MIRKLDPLLVLVVLLTSDSATTMNCKLPERTGLTQRLCLELNDDGNFRGKVVSCGRSEACENPEYYPCGQQEINLGTSTGSSNGVTIGMNGKFQGISNGTTTPTPPLQLILPIKNANLFKYNMTIDGSGQGNTTTVRYPSTDRTLTTKEFPSDQNLTSTTSTGTTKVTETEETTSGINSTCKTTTTEVPLNTTWTTPIPPCDSSERLPAPLCHQYYVCSSLKYLLQTCPDGSAFDRKSKRCTASQARNCSHATAVTTRPTNPLNQLINGANIIISAITAVLIVLGFILIDFIL